VKVLRVTRKGKNQPYSFPEIFGEYLRIFSSVYNRKFRLDAQLDNAVFAGHGKLSGKEVIVLFQLGSHFDSGNGKIEVLFSAEEGYLGRDAVMSSFHSKEHRGEENSILKLYDKKGHYEVKAEDYESHGKKSLKDSFFTIMGYDGPVKIPKNIKMYFIGYYDMTPWLMSETFKRTLSKVKDIIKEGNKEFRISYDIVSRDEKRRIKYEAKKERKGRSYKTIEKCFKRLMRKAQQYNWSHAPSFGSQKELKNLLTAVGQGAFDESSSKTRVPTEITITEVEDRRGLALICKDIVSGGAGYGSSFFAIVRGKKVVVRISNHLEDVSHRDYDDYDYYDD